MVSNVDLAVDFLNVNWPTRVNLVEEPEVLDSHMPSAISHLLGLGERQCTGVVFVDSRFGHVWNWVSEVSQNEVLISSMMRRSGISEHML
jgi:hypothetical protein